MFQGMFSDLPIFFFFLKGMYYYKELSLLILKTFVCARLFITICVKQKR